MSNFLMQLSGQAENRFYGHVDILAKYAGLVGTPFVNGYIQHGWNATDGFGNYLGSKRFANKFVWSKRCEEIIKKNGKKNVFAIGAPWIYLSDIYPSISTGSKKGVIAYPAHSSSWSKLGNTSNEYAQFLKEKYGTVTVVLHRYDFLSPEKKDSYLNFGHVVTTHGIGTPWEKGFDPLFLKNQRDLLNNFSIITSNVTSTPILYGMSLGLKAEIGGPVDYSITNSDDKASQTGDGNTNWNLLVEKNPIFWQQELGIENKKTPQELKEILGWSPTSKKSTSYIFLRAKDLITGSNKFVSVEVFKANFKNKL